MKLLFRSIIYYLLNYSRFSPAESRLKVSKLSDYMTVNKHSNSLTRYGYLVSSSFLPSHIVSQLLSFAPTSSNDHIATTTPPDSLISSVHECIDTHLGDYLRSYLGGPYLLYRTVLKRVSYSNKSARSISSFWHYDLVGQRLKLFFFLNPSHSVSTDLIPSTHFSIKPSNFIASRILFYFWRLFHYTSPRNVQPIKNTFLLFDTNLFHRAFLKPSSNNDYRLTLQVDIMATSKFNDISEYGDLVGL
jgi:hypothetical protein